ncbi:GNAT family N-acetyltransferase [Azospirillum sp. sgz301742]
MRDDSTPRRPMPARVRPAGPEDAEAILPLIERHFGTGINRDLWRRLFECSWSGGTQECGWVLDQGGRIVGFLGAVYAERDIDGRPQRFCNLTSMCVDVEHRGMAPFLIMAAARRTDCTVTDLSPRPSVLRLLEKAGFTLLDPGKLIIPPLLNAGTLAHGRPAITCDPDRIRLELDQPMRRILDDHVPYGCLALLAQRDGGRCLLVVKRRTVRRVPLSEILFASAPDFLARHIDAIAWTLTVRQRTLAVSGDRRLFGDAPPRSFFLKSISMVRSTRLTREQIDNLYTELVLLPI